MSTTADLLVTAVTGTPTAASAAGVVPALLMASATGNPTGMPAVGAQTSGPPEVVPKKGIGVQSVAGGGGGGMCDEKTVEYLRDLIAEKQSLLNNNSTNSLSNPNLATASENGLEAMATDLISNSGDNNKGADQIGSGTTNATTSTSTFGAQSPPKNIVMRLLDQGNRLRGPLETNVLWKLIPVNGDSLKVKAQNLVLVAIIVSMHTCLGFLFLLGIACNRICHYRYLSTIRP